ncbi:hypothetical protein COCNU_scaffold000495G000040 [Cocos nucifera]|nr:hypothetical protein [Cocos nucifera]
MSSRRWSTSIADSTSPMRPSRPSMLTPPSMTFVPAWTGTSPPPHQAALEYLNCANAANHSLPSYGIDSSTDHTHTSVITGLCKKIKHSMEGFNEPRKRVAADYQEPIEW